MTLWMSPKSKSGSGIDESAKVVRCYMGFSPFASKIIDYNLHTCFICYMFLVFKADSFSSVSRQGKQLQFGYIQVYMHVCILSVLIPNIAVNSVTVLGVRHYGNYTMQLGKTGE